jgi:hypothetical protein
MKGELPKKLSLGNGAEWRLRFRYHACSLYIIKKNLFEKGIIT